MALCDDHPFMLDGQRASLVAMGHDVVCMALRGRELLQHVQAGIHIDLAVVDLSMPGLSGMDTIARLVTLRPRVKCLVMSVHDDPGRVAQVLSVGALGYVLKTAGVAVFTQAVQAVLSGDTYVSPELGYSIARYGRKQYFAERVLSLREREVLKLIADGYSDKRVGEELGISTRTVRFHRDALRRDFNCPTTADLTKLAMRYGITYCGGGQFVECAGCESAGRDVLNNVVPLAVSD